MKHLLIVYHSKTGHTAKLAEAVHEGATNPEVDDVKVLFKLAAQADADDLRWADGLILGTPENFGYMSGMLKDFLDRTYYEVEGELQPLPYAIFISAENDGSGAVTAIQRIAKGYPFTQVHEPLIVKGEVTEADQQTARDLGLTLAVGLETGIY